MSDLTVKLGGSANIYEPMSKFDGDEPDYLLLRITNNTFMDFAVSYQCGMCDLKDYDDVEDDSADKAYGPLSTVEIIKGGESWATQLRDQHWPFDDQKNNEELQTIQFWVRVDYYLAGEEKQSIRTRRVIVSKENIGPKGDPDGSSDNYVPLERGDLDDLGWSDAGNGLWKQNVDGHTVIVREEYLLAKKKLWDGAVRRLERSKKTATNLYTTAQQFKNDIENGKNIAKLLRYYLHSVFAPTVEPISPIIEYENLENMLKKFPTDVSGRIFLDPVHRNKVANLLLRCCGEVFEEVSPENPSGSLHAFLFKPDFYISGKNLSDCDDSWFLEKDLEKKVKLANIPLPSFLSSVDNEIIIGIVIGPGNTVSYFCSKQSIKHYFLNGKLGSSEWVQKLIDTMVDDDPNTPKLMAIKDYTEDVLNWWKPGSTSPEYLVFGNLGKLKADMTLKTIRGQHIYILDATGPYVIYQVVETRRVFCQTFTGLHSDIYFGAIKEAAQNAEGMVILADYMTAFMCALFPPASYVVLASSITQTAVTVGKYRKEIIAVFYALTEIVPWIEEKYPGLLWSLTKKHAPDLLLKKDLKAWMTILGKCLSAGGKTKGSVDFAQRMSQSSVKSTRMLIFSIIKTAVIGYITSTFGVIGNDVKELKKNVTKKLKDAGASLHDEATEILINNTEDLEELEIKLKSIGDELKKLEDVFNKM